MLLFDKGKRTKGINLSGLVWKTYRQSCDYLSGLAAYVSRKDGDACSWASRIYAFGCGSGMILPKLKNIFDLSTKMN